MNETCHIRDESQHTCTWVTTEWLIVHSWMKNVTHTPQRHACVMRFIHMWHVCVTAFIYTWHVCVTAFTHTWHVCVTAFIHMWHSFMDEMTSHICLSDMYVWRHSFICDMYLWRHSFTCDMYLWRHSFICDMYVWRHSLICDIIYMWRYIYRCAVMNSCVWHVSFIWRSVNYI